MPSQRRSHVNAKSFVETGGKIHVVYTGELSRRMVGADVRSLDGRDLDLADRVLVLAQKDDGYAGCVITPEADETCTETPSSITPSGTNDSRMFHAMMAAVGYDNEAAVVAMRACGLDADDDKPEEKPRKMVKAAVRTAIARLELYGPIETSFTAPLEIAFHALSGVDHEQVILHGDRPRTTPPPKTPVAPQPRRSPDLGDTALELAALSADTNYPGHAGTKNDIAELFALTRWFTEEVGGRIVDYNTARSGLPAGTPNDGHRRRVIVAICPDGLAGASVWHVSNELVAFEGDVKRARREMRACGVEGLIDVDYEPSYVPFDLRRNTGTAIRRALKSPFTTEPDATDAALAALVLGKNPHKPCLRGSRRKSPLVVGAVKAGKEKEASKDKSKYGLTRVKTCV